MTRLLASLIVLLVTTGQAQDNWEQKYPITSPSPRWEHVMASIGDDKVLLFSGVDGQEAVLTDTWVYDLSDNTWTQKVVPASPQIVGGGLAYIGDDKVLYFGGIDAATLSTLSNETWVYDLSENTWTIMTPSGNVPTARLFAFVAYAGGDQVVLFGGWDNVQQNTDTWVYDLSANTWTQKSPSTQPANHGIAVSMTSFGGDQVLLITNSSSSPNESATWLYDVSDDSWLLKKEAAQPPSNNEGQILTHVPGTDRAILFGGYPATSLTYLYDHSDNQWTAPYSPTIPDDRWRHKMAPIGTGKVLLFGGATLTYLGNTLRNDTWVFNGTLPSSTHQILASAGQGGSITPAGSVLVAQGEDQLFTFTPDAGYQLTSVTVDGNPVPNPSLTYSFIDVTMNHTISVQFAPLPGSIAGTVSTGSGGVGGVTVKLLDAAGNPVAGVPQIFTDATGAYSFTDLPPAAYQVMIVEPLGYIADQNPKTVIVLAGTPHSLHFVLDAITVLNDARGKGYWKHQFDVFVTSQGQAQETAAQLGSYIAAVHTRYTPHYGIFAGVTSFAGWQGVLTVNGNQPMATRAKAQLAALLMNVMSLKVGQHAVATADGRTTADVLSYVSDLLTDNSASNDGLAKDLAESVNQQQLIDAGIVPAGAIVYKDGTQEHSSTAVFHLGQNYPNPFNPVTVIRYAIPEREHVRIRVFDVAGNPITTLVDGEMDSGSHVVEFNAAQFPSGLYLYRLEAGSRSLTGTMTLMK